MKETWEYEVECKKLYVPGDEGDDGEMEFKRVGLIRRLNLTRVGGPDFLPRQYRVTQVRRRKTRLEDDGHGGERIVKLEDREVWYSITSMEVKGTCKSHFTQECDYQTTGRWISEGSKLTDDQAKTWLRKRLGKWTDEIWQEMLDSEPPVKEKSLPEIFIPELKSDPVKAQPVVPAVVTTAASVGSVLAEQACTVDVSRFQTEEHKEISTMSKNDVIATAVTVSTSSIPTAEALADMNRAELETLYIKHINKRLPMGAGPSALRNWLNKKREGVV